MLQLKNFQGANIRELVKTIRFLKSVQIKINNESIKAEEGQKLIEAIKDAGVTVPSICYHSDLPKSGGICRLCMVKDEKNPNKFICSCKTPVMEGMDINTVDPILNDVRRANNVLMYNYHPFKCLTCSNAEDCIKNPATCSLHF